MARLMFICIAVLLLPGCGGDGFDRIPVAGTVTLDGEPIDGAAVTFIPTTQGEALTGEGRTDHEGNFVLRSKGEQGLPPGSYKVAVRKVSGEGAEINDDMTDEEQNKAMFNAMMRPQPTVFLVPKKYASIETSGLTFEVSSDAEKNKFEITLTGR